MNAKTYAECLSSDMNRGIAITDMLEEILISENGKIDNFQKVAENQMIPDVFSDSVQALTDFGYDYCLSKTVSPQSEEYEEVYSSRESLDNPVTICVGVQMDIDDLIRHADLALYEVKLQGKHNCLAYRGDYRTQHRSRLGFALQDASETDTKSMGKIVVGCDDYTPFSYMDVNGNQTGIDVELATEAFYRMGYEPDFTFINWEEKKDLFANNPPATFDAILMDIMMPVMDAHLAKPLDVKKAIDIICKLVGRK